MPPRAKTPASHAPKAGPKLKQSANLKVVPKTNLPVRNLEAARGPFLKVEKENMSLNCLPVRTVSFPNPQPSTLPPTPGLALSHSQAPRIDSFCINVPQGKNVRIHASSKFGLFEMFTDQKEFGFFDKVQCLS